MKCLNCGKEFTAQRSTAKFDSPKCRKEYFLKNSVPNDKKDEPQNAKTPKTVSINDMTDDELMKEADRMATRDYLSRGWYGGKAVVEKGVVVGRKYFPFDAVKQKYYLWLTEKRHKD